MVAVAREGGRRLRREAVKVGVGANQRAKVSFGTTHTRSLSFTAWMWQWPLIKWLTWCQVRYVFPLLQEQRLLLTLVVVKPRKVVQL